MVDFLRREMDNTPPQIVFADHAGDFSPTAGNNLQEGTPTEVQLSMASVANGAARQSTQFDLGTPWAEEYKVRAAFEFAATPVAGQVVEAYIAPSSSDTAATGNPGGVGGADSAYTGYSANLADSVEQLDFIGEFIVTVDDTAVVQIIELNGAFFPKERYGTLVLKNEAGAAFHSDDVEIHIVFDPVVTQG